MGSLGTEAPPPAVKLAPVLPDYYAELKTDAKRTIDTLEESCTWGNTPDGGMSAFDWFTLIEYGLTDEFCRQIDV